MLIRLTIIFLIAVASVAAQSEQTFVPPASAAPTGGRTAVAADWRAEMLARGKEKAEFGEAAASADGLRLTTVKLTRRAYELGVSARTAVPLKKGQVLLLRFAARSIQPAAATGQTRLGVFFQKNTPDWFKSLQTEIQLGSNWRRFDFPFVVREDYQLGAAAIGLIFGYAPQIAEVADLQLLAYGENTALAALPRTENLSGEPAPQDYRAAVERIQKFRRLLLAANKNPAPAPNRTLRVAADAAPNGDGSPEKPFRTIQAAVDASAPGDTISVAAGVYRDFLDAQAQTRITKKNRSAAWLVIRAAPGARPKIVSGSWQTFDVRGAAYVEIRGFEFEGFATEANQNSNNAIRVDENSHHIRLIDNYIHDFGGGGIAVMLSDYLHIEGNTVRSTSHGSDWGNSAISILQPFNSDDLPGYHIVIRRNICYDNENTRPFRFGGGELTDGNDIIIDNTRRSPRDSRPESYRHWTLIENNLVYNNGGRGIHTFVSDRVDAINNTSFYNLRTPTIRNGEITAIQSSEINYFNNLVVTRPDARANAEDYSQKIVWAHNLFFNTTDFLAGKAAVTKNPLLIRARVESSSAADFGLLANSPARGIGLKAVAPPDDLFGRQRAKTVDLGAIQGSGAGNRSTPKN